jgi:transposase
MISSKNCLKCGSQNIQLDDDTFSCNNCGLSFCCFGGQK